MWVPPIPKVVCSSKTSSNASAPYLFHQWLWCFAFATFSISFSLHVSPFSLPFVFSCATSFNIYLGHQWKTMYFPLPIFSIAFVINHIFLFHQWKHISNKDVIVPGVVNIYEEQMFVRKRIIDWGSLWLWREIFNELYKDKSLIYFRGRKL